MVWSDLNFLMERCCWLYFVQLTPVVLPSNLHCIFAVVAVAVGFVYGIVFVGSVSIFH